jgi:hypothetical protein
VLEELGHDDASEPEDRGDRESISPVMTMRATGSAAIATSPTFRPT